MSLYDERIADLREIEPELPNTFLFGDDTGPCMVTSKRMGRTLQVGGKLITIRQTLFVRCELFVTEPKQMQAIKTMRATDADYTEYRIAEVIRAADSAHYEIALTTLSEK